MLYGELIAYHSNLSFVALLSIKLIVLRLTWQHCGVVLGAAARQCLVLLLVAAAQQCLVLLLVRVVWV